MNAEQNAARLEVAKALLMEALIQYGVDGNHHAPDCVTEKFAIANRMLPPSHPIWKHAPDCSCILGKIANFLNEH